MNRNWYPWSPTPAASYLATPIMPNLSHAMSRSRTTDTMKIAHSTTVPDPPCPIAIVATGSFNRSSMAIFVVVPFFMLHYRYCLTTSLRSIDLMTRCSGREQYLPSRTIDFSSHPFVCYCSTPSGVSFRSMPNFLLMVRSCAPF